MTKLYYLIFFTLLSPDCFSQTAYFYQDFSGTESFVNPNPNPGQFSNVVETSPNLSFHKFHKGYMDLMRTQQDSATGGIIRVLRAVPFSPNPENLFIQMKISVEEMQSISLNAIYFYAGENFSATNNSFPSNDLMFGRFSIHFQGTTFAIRDTETQTTSKSYPAKIPVILTWVLNNSTKENQYKLTRGASFMNSVKPGSFDLWVNDEPVKLNIPAYPANSPHSTTKLTNFEMRFRNGIGKIRIHNLLITDVAESLASNTMSSASVNPNPSSPHVIHLKAFNVDPFSLKLRDTWGRLISVDINREAANLLNIYPKQFISSGIYILVYNQNNIQKSVRVMVD